MQKKLKNVFMICIFMFSIFLNINLVKAYETTSKLVIQSGNAVGTYVNSVNTKVDKEVKLKSKFGREATVLKFEQLDNQNTLVFIFDYYSQLASESDKGKILDITISELKRSQINSQDKQRIFNFLKSVDNTQTSRIVTKLGENNQEIVDKAFEDTKWIRDFFQYLFGIVVIFFLILLNVQFYMDLLFLVVGYGLKRWIFENRGESKIKSEWRWISTEAEDALNEKEAGSPKNTILIYLPKKLLQICIMVLTIGILYNGVIFRITGFLVELIMNVFDVLRGVYS